MRDFQNRGSFLSYLSQCSSLFIILPSRSTLTGIHISFIISPVMARSILFIDENSYLSMMLEAVEPFIKKHWFPVQLTILYSLSQFEMSVIIPFSNSSGVGTYTRSFGDNMYLGSMPSSFEGAGESPCFNLSMTTFSGIVANDRFFIMSPVALSVFSVSYIVLYPTVCHGKTCSRTTDIIKHIGDRVVILIIDTEFSVS